MQNIIKSVKMNKKNIKFKIIIISFELFQHFIWIKVNLIGTLHTWYEFKRHERRRWLCSVFMAVRFVTQLDSFMICGAVRDYVGGRGFRGNFNKQKQLNEIWNQTK